MSPVQIAMNPTNEDEEIEREIEEQLKLINVDEDYCEEEDLGDEEDKESSSNKESPSEFDEYLKKQNQRLLLYERELAECDDVIQHITNSDGVDEITNWTSKVESNKATINRQILKAIEDEVNSLGEDEEMILADENEAKFGDVMLNLETLEGETPRTPHPAPDFHEFIKEQWQMMEERQQRHDIIQQKFCEERILLKNNWLEENQKRDSQLNQEFEQNLEISKREQLRHDKELEEWEVTQAEKIEQSLQAHQADIAKLSEENERERAQFETDKKLLDDKLALLQQSSAVTIQSFFRSTRESKKYTLILKQKREERRKVREHEHIRKIDEQIKKRQMEVDKHERHLEAERILAEESRRLEERRLMIEEEKLAEEKRKVEEKRIGEERKLAEEILEKERKTAEDKRIAKQKLEEEKQRLAEEKQRIADEKQRLVEEKRLTKEKKLEEKKLAKERKLAEEKRIADEKKAEKERKIEDKRILAEKKLEEKRLKEENKLNHDKLLDTKIVRTSTNLEETKCKSDKVSNESISKKADDVQGENAVLKHIRDTELTETLSSDGANKNVHTIGIESVVYTDECVHSNDAVQNLNTETDDNKRVDESLDLNSKRMDSTTIENSQDISNYTQILNNPDLNDEVKLCENKVSATNEGVNTREVEMRKYLPERVESMRKAWMKDCIRWSKISNEPWKSKSPRSKPKPRRRPSAIKRLPELPLNLILDSAAALSPDQVTSVELSDLEPSNISTLTQCPHLSHLTITNCGLTAVDGLSSCTQLQFIDVSNNHITYTDFSNLTNLHHINLSHNHLTSIHGFGDCHNLRWLDLSNNRLSKIGSLEGLHRLHTLHLHSNQLISCVGIKDCPYLQYVQLSHNLLQNLDDLTNLCLLRSLDVTGNSLRQFPNLQNHVLLQKLLLGDNNITDISSVCDMWLPALEHLVLSQNGIQSLPHMDHLLRLSHLHLDNNQLSDCEELCDALKHCPYLSVLHLLENPVAADSEYRSTLFHRIPQLTDIDGTANSTSQIIRSQSEFETMCQVQAKAFTCLEDDFHRKIKSLKENHESAEKLNEAYFKFCDCTYKLAVEQRSAHEYGETHSKLPSPPQSTQQNSSRTPRQIRDQNRASSAKLKFEQVVQSHSENSEKLDEKSGDMEFLSVAKLKFEQAVQNENSNVCVQSYSKQRERTGFLTCDDSRKEFKSENVNNFSNSNETSNIGMNERTQVQLESQNVFVPERNIKSYNKSDMSADKYCTDTNLNKNTPRSFTNNNTRQSAKENTIHTKERSFTIGNSKLPITELNMTANDKDRTVTRVTNEKFHRAATVIQAHWRGYLLRNTLMMALEYAQFESSSDSDAMSDVDLNEFNFDESQLDDWIPPEIPDIPSSHVVLGKPPKHATIKPQAWQTDAQSPRRPIVSRLDIASVTSCAESEMAHTIRSRKEENIANDWGFHDTHTAELMVARANKMKYRAERRKKLGKLDPQQRLALFRKLEKVPQYTSVNRKVLPRKEYFQAQAQRAKQEEASSNVERECETRSYARTYEWLHSQPPIPPTPSMHGVNEVANIHRMMGDIATTKPSGPQLDLESVSSQGSRSFQSRRLSSYNPSPKVHVQFPPIHDNSSQAGSRTSSQALRKNEKISWRKPDTNKSVGWGAGRKRKP